MRRSRSRCERSAAWSAQANPGFYASPLFGLAATNGTVLVADAGKGIGGNDLLRVDERGHVERVAVFPDELVSTANLKRLEGCPDSHSEFCGLPDMMPTEAVPTSVAIGPDGAYYVGELKGFPAPTGESRIWRVDRTAKGVLCGTDARCTLAFDGGFTSIIDLAFKNGKLYVAQIDDASFWAVESGGPSPGGSVHACDLVSRTCQGVVSGIPMLTAIAFRGSHLWGTVSALIPGQADAVRIA